jgi:hypothetical protein
MPLADDDIRAIVARADEIQRSSGVSRADVEALLRTGEELGITKAAMERAVREHMGSAAEPPKIGELTFARSTDEKYYVARVTASTDEEYQVQFLRGGERTLAQDELRASSFLPGERVVCPWPSWGPWTCTILSYDAAKNRVTVTDGWGETRSFALEEIWLAPRTASRRRRLRLYAVLLGAGAAVGAAIGALVTAFLM